MDPAVWRQAKEVLAAVLTCPPAERDAVLLARCPDPVIRRETESYLRDYDPNFLETVITVSDVFDQSDLPREPIDLPPGTRIGPYVVIDHLGAGGMGQVFLGSDTRLHRRVALKCLLSGTAGDLRSKILHEARAAARISHPNIATVHDVIEEEGRAFIVMEYVEGDSLANVLRRDRLPIDRVLAIGRQLASALAAAHAKGIIHRDLKPANVQVMPDGAVKVLDFGVAQAVSVITADTAARTTAFARSGGDIAHPGTPAYMSPEQMLGRNIDHRSDIYSLGVMLYEMATGHRPYSSTDPLDLVVSLSKRLLRADIADPRVPREVSDVIDRALAVKPDERFQTAAELGAELAALEREFDVEAVRPTIRPARRSTAITVLRFAGLVALVPIVLALLGFMSTAIFNQTLGRTTPFDRESPMVWIAIGRRSLVSPAVYIAGMFVVIAAVKFTIRLLMLSDKFDHLLTTSRTQTRRLTVRLGLDDPTTVGQAVAAFGVVAIAAVGWRFWPTIRACIDNVNLAPKEQLERLQLGGPSSEAALYRFVLDVVILGLGTAIFRIVRLRARQPIKHGLPALALVVTMLVLTVAMSELPYRVIWQNQSERVDYAGERCYIIGTSDDRSLIFCPDKTPPRNRIVYNNDPALHRVGIVENIFNPPETAR